MRVLLGAFGDPGHVFPLMALGRRLRERGHEPWLHSSERWRRAAEAEGIGFLPAPSIQVLPGVRGPLKPFEAVRWSVPVVRETLRALRPDVVVADILTLAPALAAELEGIPLATCIPHVDPRPAPGTWPYALGARLPRTRLGRRIAERASHEIQDRGLAQGERELDGTRSRVGLPPAGRVHGGISRALALVATFPQLEYPRPPEPGTHVVGPLQWEPDAAPVELPPGDDPLVLVAPSTSQDPEHRMLRAALEGLADLPVRVLATYNRRVPDPPLGPLPANARLVEWVSYARTMPLCDVVVCHAGHGTICRALLDGVPVVACPAAGDMNENAARVDWAGVGVRLPRRHITPTGLRLAVGRALGEPGFAARARDLAAWGAAHDPTGDAVDLLEELAAPERVGSL